MIKIIIFLLIFFFSSSIFAADSYEVLELKKANLELTLQVLELSWKEKKRELDELSKQLEQEKSKQTKVEKK